MTKRGEWDSKESKDRELFGELSVDIEVDESKKQASQLQENAVEDCLQDISATYDDQVQDYKEHKEVQLVVAVLLNHSDIYFSIEGITIRMRSDLKAYS